MKTFKFTLLFTLSIIVSILNAQDLVFDGVDDYVEVPQVGNGVLNDFSSPHDFTIEIRFQLNAVPGNNNATLVSKHSNPADGFFMEFPSGTTNLNAGMGYNGNYSTNTTASALSLDTWYQAAFVYNESTNAFKFYIDGVLEGSEVILGGSYYPETDFAIAIGRSLKWDSPGMITVDYFRVWDDQRTDAEIITNKDVEVACSADNLLLQYDFNTGTVVNNAGIVTAADCTPNAYDATLYNFDSSVNTTGILKESINVVVFPNPTTDIVTLKMENINEPTIQATVLDVTGSVLSSFVLNTTLAQIDFSTYPKGIYFIQVQTASNSQIVKIEKL